MSPLVSTVVADEAEGSAHRVAFVDRPDDLDALARTLTLDALRAGESVVVVADGGRIERLGQTLHDEGYELGSLAAAGRLLVLDAHRLITRFVRGGEPDREGFGRFADQLLEHLAAGPPLTVYGEMVGILWHLGHVGEALELETWWNDLQAEHPMTLWCPCGIGDVSTSDDLAAVGRLCAEHGLLVGPPSYREGSLDGEVQPARREVSQLVVPVPDAVGAVRRFVAAWLQGWGEADVVISDAVLAASELATNAVRHSHSPFRVGLHRLDDGVRLSVHDSSPTMPVRIDAADHQYHGRGVALIEGLARDWGAEPTPDGKVVWAVF